MLDRWITTWRRVKDSAAVKYADLTIGYLDDDGEALPASKLHSVAVRGVLRVELFAERMEVLGHVLEQRAPEDANSHSVHLEEVGRAVYTAKAIVALLLDRQRHLDHNHDPVVVAVFNIEKCLAESTYERWEEIAVPLGLRGWSYELRSDTSA